MNANTPSRTVSLYDAHNHLQDERLAHCLEEILTACGREGIRRMVVNGSCEEDWPRVLDLVRRHPLVLPAFGYHPWHVRERSANWFDNLRRHLDATPSAIGEIGLDRWIENPDLELQEEMFRAQLRLAAERDLPVTIHCLKAWGWLDRILREERLPSRGFLLHSYGGPSEMVAAFAALGGYFSLSGYFAHDRKLKQREVFRLVPPDRLLLETDAPDMWPPDGWNRYRLTDTASGKPLNHPANLGAVYDFAAGLFEIDRERLTNRIADNFARLFRSE